MSQIEAVPVASLHQGGSLATLILNSFSRFADRPAIADEECRWSYQQLAEIVARTITVFADAGLKRGDGVAILSANRAYSWAAVCAIGIMGLRYSPLHPMAAEDEHAFVLADSEAVALLVDAETFGDRGAALRDRFPELRAMFAIGPLAGATELREAIRGAPPSPLRSDVEPGDLAWLMYTGGTTGRSKGVMLPHRVMATVAVAHAAEWDWPAETRFAIVTPISHSAGALMYSIMFRGGYARLLQGFDAEKFCAVVEAEKLNAAFLVPTLIGKLLEASAVRARHNLTSLDMIGYGAAPITAHLLRRGISEFGNVFVQLYGQSEAPQCVLVMRKSDHDTADDRRLESCGRLNPLIELKLFDEDMREVAVGEPGEICLRGPMVMDGYWKQPELTAEVFRGGWLHTGDVAICDEQGYYYIVDRIKDMIISGGFNIYPREVEDALHVYPGIARAAVIGVPDEKWGEAVMAFVVAEEGTDLDIDAVRSHVRERKGAAWVPKAFEIVADLPLTSLGKLDRKALRAPFWDSRKRGVV